MPNIEHTEQSFPLLFLYRKELPDSGGAGKYRGGLSAESCFIPHNTDVITQDTLSSGNATPTSPGMMGGYPAATNKYTFIKDSDILDRMGAREMPDDTADVEGERVTLGLREQNFTQAPNDVYAVRWTGGGGFGDPMDRDIEDIEADLEAMAVTPGAARTIYGAVFKPDGTIDKNATQEHRAAIRKKRLNGANGKTRKLDGELVLQATEYLSVRRGDGGANHWACAKCATDLGPVEENYKLGCLREDRPVSESNPLIGETKDHIDDEVVFRQFYCPGCGTLIENEVSIASDPPLMDISIAL